jgi:SpoVK/Ycf46/Vps4 family AAA+-type ATPase
MAIVNIVRFKVRPEDADEMVVRRDALVDAAREASPGLRRAVLSKVDDESWVDIWHWDSEESLTAAQTVVGPVAQAAMELVKDAEFTRGRLVSSR